MSANRREMIKMMALSGLGFAGSRKKISAAPAEIAPFDSLDGTLQSEDLTLIGAYGKPVTEWKNRQLPSFSYRRNEWTDLEQWRQEARKQLTARMGMPPSVSTPQVTVRKEYDYDGLHIQELTWQLPYGAATEGILLKPLNAHEPLPGVLAFHDHSGDKYFGARKITRTSDSQHPLVDALQKKAYEGRAWANELAKRGYVVLAPDAFAFASRRVLLKDVPASLRKGLNDNDPEHPEQVHAYNQWAGEHEHVLAKSLFSAGTTWPAMFFSEDRVALDILCKRKDVDASRVGCGGLSGGGIRTVYMSGLDPRIRCSVTAGFMTTWDDFVLNKSVSHTWMTYVPLLAGELEFPEILGLRAPSPALVLNNNEDTLFTLAEMKKAETILSEVYQKAGKPERLKCSYYPGLHKFDKSMQLEAFDWFDKWLKV